jgi:LmbE family N-acetylglucosaminyl deacetylase
MRPRRRRRRTVGPAALRALVLAIVALALIDVARTSPEAPDRLGVRDGERLVVIAPHPDDETIGAGGLIQRVLARHGSVQVVLVTAGDGNVGGVVLETGLRQPPPANFVAYGERRVGETRAALQALGAPASALDVLGFPDGALMPLLSRHWRRAQPVRSATTDASDPPYAFAIDPDMPYDGADLRDELARVLREVRPTMIALPDPIDRHPDHAASGVLSILAIDEWIGGRWPRRQPPRVLTYLVHWPDWPPGWDAAAPAAAADQPLALPPTLPVRPLDTAMLDLTVAEVAVKRGALAAHASQQHAMGAFLAAFVRRSEPFTLLDTTEVRSIASNYERDPEQHVQQAAPPAAG